MWKSSEMARERRTEAARAMRHYHRSVAHLPEEASSPRYLTRCKRGRREEMRWWEGRGGGDGADRS
jgi:hypothetical protein